MSIDKNGEIWRSSICGASLVAQREKNLPAMWKMRAWSLGEEDPLEKGMATHISILAWQIPRTSWVWYCIIILQIVPIEGNCSGVLRISLYYFLKLQMKLQSSKNKRFSFLKKKKIKEHAMSDRHSPPQEIVSQGKCWRRREMLT